MKSTRQWERLHSEPGPDLGLFKVRQDSLKNPVNGKTVTVAVLSSNDAVNVLALTKAGTAVLIDNYRFGIGAHIIEVPGGLVDDGEDHQQAGRRELLEETGYTARAWHYAGCVAANPVFQDSYIHHYLALDAELTGATDFDDAEDIRVREVPLEEVRRMLLDGEFQHPHTVSGVLRGLEVLRRMGGEYAGESNA